MTSDQARLHDLILNVPEVREMVFEQFFDWETNSETTREALEFFEDMGVTW